MISVLILTLNEEVNLPRCLESVSWSDDIVVFDSYSNDRTLEIANAASVRVIQRKFDNWASHQNWALKNIEFKYPWVYYSDADEVVTKELREEMLAISNDSDVKNVAYWVRYRNYFWGKWIKHCGIYPVWLLRFFQPDKIKWKRLVNPDPIIDGPEGRLIGHFEHYSFNKGLTAWFIKHSVYAEQEAYENLRELKESSVDFIGLISVLSPPRRRKALKELSFRLPLRPVFRFIYMYIFRLGFLDGRAGLTYCCLLSIYEYMIVLNMKEKSRCKKGLSR